MKLQYVILGFILFCFIHHGYELWLEISKFESQSVDCMVSDWGPWSYCTKSTFRGSKSRKRTIFRYPKSAGLPCPVLEETIDCDDGCFLISCQIRDWTMWGECSKTCGTGYQSRFKAVKPGFFSKDSENMKITKDQDFVANECTMDCRIFSGKECRKLEEERECNTFRCPIHCIVSEWSKWSECSQTCGFGFVVRERSILQFPKYKEEKCPKLYQERYCDFINLADECEEDEEDQSSWYEWKECVTNDTEVKKRKRIRMSSLIDEKDPVDEADNGLVYDMYYSDTLKPLREVINNTKKSKKVQRLIALMIIGYTTLIRQLYSCLKRMWDAPSDQKPKRIFSRKKYSQRKKNAFNSKK